MKTLTPFYPPSFTTHLDTHRSLRTRLVGVFFLLLVLLPIPVASIAYGQVLPSDLISSAIQEKRTIVRIKVTPISDAMLDQWTDFFSEKERRALSLTTAQVSEVLYLGSIPVKIGQSLLLSEATKQSYLGTDDEFPSSEEDAEYPITSAAFLQEGHEYLYIVGTINKYAKKSGKKKATFSVISELERKGIFEIVSSDDDKGFIPAVTETELEEIKALIPPPSPKAQSQSMNSASTTQPIRLPQTKLAQRVAKKLAAQGKAP